MLHRARDLLVRQRTMLINALRGHLAEFGIVAPQGISRVAELLAVLRRARTRPGCRRWRGRRCAGWRRSWKPSAERIDEAEAAILAWHKDNEASRRLATIPGIGPITASRIVADGAAIASSFASARHFAAWIGLSPKQHSSGGKAAAGRHLQAGRPLPAPAAGARRDRRDPPCRGPRHAGRAGSRRLLERRPARSRRWRWPTRPHGSPGRLLAQGEAYRRPQP